MSAPKLSIPRAASINYPLIYVSSGCTATVSFRATDLSLMKEYAAVGNIYGVFSRGKNHIKKGLGDEAKSCLLNSLCGV